MSHNHSTKETIIGIVLIVVVGLIALWTLKTVLSFVWEYFWFFVAIVVGAVSLYFWFAARKIP